MIEVGKTKLSIGEFNGNYYLKEVWVNRDGEIKDTWILRKFKKDEGYLERTMQIPLGTKDTAADNLRAIYSEIYGDDSVPF